MAALPYLILDSTGQPAEQRGVQSSAGAGDAGKYPALDAAGKLDSTFMPAGLAVDAITVLASETIAAGAMVNVYNNAGTLNVRNADQSTASRGKYCNGFCNVGISSAASGTVTFSGIVSGQTALTPGATQFLGTAGAITTTVNVTAGQICQEVGYALSATTMQFYPGYAFLRA